MAPCEAKRAGAPKSQVAWILAALFCVLILDQLTKAVIVATVPEGQFLFDGEGNRFFDITFERNTGLAGGAFRNIPGVVYAAPITAMLILLYLFRHLSPGSHLQNIAYGLVAGGAVGNLVDRVLRGFVVDFLQFHFYFIRFDFPWKYYPAFNVADSAICVGVFFLVVCWHRAGKTDVARTH